MRVRLNGADRITPLSISRAQSAAYRTLSPATLLMQMRYTIDSTIKPNLYLMHWLRGHFFHGSRGGFHELGLRLLQGGLGGADLGSLAALGVLQVRLPLGVRRVELPADFQAFIIPPGSRICVFFHWDLFIHQPRKSVQMSALY